MSSTPERPSPGLMGLLNRLVDRLDSAEQRGSANAQSVALGERLWPELYGADYESEKAELWSRVQALARQGWLHVTPPAALASSSGYAMAPRIRVLDPAAVRQATGRLERPKSLPERWREAVEEALDAHSETKTRVAAYCLELPGHSLVEVVGRLNALKTLQEQPLLLREVSSRLFWGMSKVLDGRQDLVAAVLEREDCPFPAAPLQLLVHLPSGPVRGALFIENQMSYEQAVRGSSAIFDGLALLYSAGFKASAARLRQPQGSSLYYSRASEPDVTRRADLESWLYEREHHWPVSFWGDLDWAGMHILAALRTSFPGVRAWEPGYAPMLELLEAGEGHTPLAADKAGQRPLGATGCSYADELLLPALRRHERFVDQEAVSL